MPAYVPSKGVTRTLARAVPRAARATSATSATKDTGSSLIPGSVSRCEQTFKLRLVDAYHRLLHDPATDVRDRCTGMACTGMVMNNQAQPVQAFLLDGQFSGLMVSGPTAAGSKCGPFGSGGQQECFVPPGNPFKQGQTVIFTFSGSPGKSLLFVVSLDGTTYIAPILLFAESTPPTGQGPSNDFDFLGPPQYTPDGSALLFTNAPGPGIFNGSQVGPQRKLAATTLGQATPLIRKIRVVVKKAGKVKLPVTPTAAGKAILEQKGSLKVRVKITFTPTGGKPASKTLSLTLRLKR